jgi:hypothetical protein
MHRSSFRDADRYVSPPRPEPTVCFSNRLTDVPHLGYAINPARDLGPRIMTAMVGYGVQGSCNFRPVLFHRLGDVLTCVRTNWQCSHFVITTGSGVPSLAHAAAVSQRAFSMISSSSVARKVSSTVRECNFPGASGQSRLVCHPSNGFCTDICMQECDRQGTCYTPRRRKCHSRRTTDIFRNPTR